MNKALYKHLLQSYGKLPGYWAALGGEVLRTVITRVFIVVMLAQIVTSIYQRNLAQYEIYIFIFLGLSVGASVIGTITDLTANKSENSCYHELVLAYYRKLTGKDMSFYKDHQTGYLASSFRQYGDGMMEFARLIRIDVVRTTIALLAPIIVLLAASWVVGLITAAVILAQFAYMSWSSTKTKKVREISHEIYRRQTGEIADSVTNIVAYKSSGNNRANIKRFSDISWQENLVFWRRKKTEVLTNLPRSIITNIGSAAAFWIIATTSQGGSSVALMVMTMTYMWQLNNVVDTIPDLLNRHNDLVLKVFHTLRYLGSDYEKIKDPIKPRASKIERGAIELNDVSFNYQSRNGQETPIFEHFNLSVRAGEQVGVVGLSGAGKSTLASLIMRFDDVDTGSIAIDGVDIREMKQDVLHRALSYVPQEPLLFHRSVRDNICYFTPDASEAEMEAAARAAHAHEFIEQLPQGYDTLVGERGVKLSGGQKQRIVIARAILKNAPAMIFDEATSALDSESEEIIQKALPEIIGRRTAIVIAHRLSTVAGLDRIIVMENGAIIEQGTHAELLKLRGRYWSLWKKQTKN